MSFPSFLSPPRLCILKKWTTYAGYGFNLHAEKGKAGQYIGKVDPDSPADHGGLKTKDYLVEVNSVNVEDLSHQKVVEIVKEMPQSVKLLVVDVETYKYCKENGIFISSSMPDVVSLTTPDTQPSAGGVIEEQDEVRINKSQQQQQKESPPQREPSPAPQSEQPQPSSNTNGSAAAAAAKDPLGNISLDDMRAKIGNNRRTQVKMNPSSFSEKHNMFQAL